MEEEEEEGRSCLRPTATGGPAAVHVRLLDVVPSPGAADLDAGCRGRFSSGSPRAAPAEEARSSVHDDTAAAAATPSGTEAVRAGQSVPSRSWWRGETEGGGGGPGYR